MRGVAYRDGHTLLLRKDVAIASIHANRYLVESLSWVIDDVQRCSQDPTVPLAGLDDVRVCIALTQELREYFLTYKRAADEPVSWVCKKRERERESVCVCVCV